MGRWGDGEKAEGRGDAGRRACEGEKSEVGSPKSEETAFGLKTRAIHSGFGIEQNSG